MDSKVIKGKGYRLVGIQVEVSRILNMVDSHHHRRVRVPLEEGCLQRRVRSGSHSPMVFCFVLLSFASTCYCAISR
jgi:hypothetical protein